MTKTITLAQVSQHKTRSDLWLVVENKVYNVSKFLDEHPGGEEVLIEQAGLDATEAFDEIGHSDDARDLLKQFYIGDLDPSDVAKKPTKPVSKPDYGAVKPAAKSPKTQAGFSVTYLLLPIIIAVALGYYLSQQ